MLNLQLWGAVAAGSVNLTWQSCSEWRTLPDRYASSRTSHCHRSMRVGWVALVGQAGLIKRLWLVYDCCAVAVCVGRLLDCRDGARDGVGRQERGRNAESVAGYGGRVDRGPAWLLVRLGAGLILLKLAGIGCNWCIAKGTLRQREGAARPAPRATVR
jgi:hypothetical protein